MKAKLICTTYNENRPNTTTNDLYSVNDDGVENAAINVYPDIEYQIIEGFGGALTEATAYTYSLMDTKTKEDFLDFYFNEEGNNYRFVRIPVDSCDFSLGHYAAVDNPNDTSLNTFSLKRDKKYIIPLLFDVEKHLGDKLQIMLSPWSPPAFMKTNSKRNNGGTLLLEYKEMWANYLCRYIQEYRELGFCVSMVSIQNEPKAKQVWDSCLYTGNEEMEFLRDYFYPALSTHKLTDIQILIWDHNKERIIERARQVITDETDSYITGLAFHWYSGDHFESLDIFNRQYPNKKLVFSEGCVEFSRFYDSDQLANARMYIHDMIGNLNSGMNIWLDWNILLNEKGGPNHANNFCDAPIMYDDLKKKIVKKLSYTYIGHISRYIRQNAVRIGISRYTDSIDATACKNTDGTVAIIMMNRENSELPVNLRIGGHVFTIELPINSISTVVIDIFDISQNTINIIK